MNHFRIYFILYLYLHITYSFPLPFPINREKFLTKFDFLFDEVHKLVKRIAENILNQPENGLMKIHEPILQISASLRNFTDDILAKEEMDMTNEDRSFMELSDEKIFHFPKFNMKNDSDNKDSGMAKIQSSNSGLMGLLSAFPLIPIKSHSTTQSPFPSKKPPRMPELTTILPEKISSNEVRHQKIMRIVTRWAKIKIFRSKGKLFINGLLNKTNTISWVFFIGPMTNWLRC